MTIPALVQNKFWIHQFKVKLNFKIWPSPEKNSADDGWSGGLAPDGAGDPSTILSWNFHIMRNIFGFVVSHFDLPGPRYRTPEAQKVISSLDLGVSLKFHFPHLNNSIYDQKYFIPFQVLNSQWIDDDSLKPHLCYRSPPHLGPVSSHLLVTVTSSMLTCSSGLPSLRITFTSSLSRTKPAVEQRSKEPLT